MKIKASRAEQERIDTAQPYLDNGKRNPKYEQFYGRFKADHGKELGEAQRGMLDEKWDREKGIDEKRKYYT